MILAALLDLSAFDGQIERFNAVLRIFLRERREILNDSLDQRRNDSQNAQRAYVHDELKLHLIWYEKVDREEIETESLG